MSYKKKTFTKRMVKAILIVAVADLQLTYALAFVGVALGRDTIATAETLSITIVTEIIAVILGYYLKSFFETKEEKKNELIERLRESEEDD